MSDTPRTQAEANRAPCLMDIVTVSADFACQLERELAAAKERIRRLEEAGDEMAWCLGEQNHFAGAWRQAREAKP